jgi:DNA-binding NtrC family response regulator
MKLLIADDHVEYCHTLEESFAPLGWEVLLAHTTADAIALLDRFGDSLDLMFLDIEFNGEQKTGLDVLDYARVRHPRVPVIMISGRGTLEMVVYATKRGAENFYDKASITTDRLIEIARAAAFKRPAQEVQDHLAFLASNGIIAQSEVMVKVARDILRYARHTLNVLILGETGTGKRLVAQAIHRASPRNKGRFVAVDIPNIPRELFQSEMFGHVRGAFTGAHQTKDGFFHAAHGGTLFLDEIGDLPVDLQVNLLVPIEEKRFYRVGSNQEETVDIRFISATDRDLGAAVANGMFRQQLYFRLREAEIIIPPLRERREDIPLIATHALAELNRGLATPKTFTPAAIEYLSSMAWPGNVRELISAVRSSFAIAADSEFITEAHVAEATTRNAPGTAGRSLPTDGTTLDRAIDEVERSAIIGALRQTKGNVTMAAALLNISRETLYTKLRKHNINPQEFRS